MKHPQTRRLAILALALFSVSVAQTGNINHGPPGKIPGDIPACADPPPADSYTQSPCWGNQQMLTTLSDKGCNVFYKRKANRPVL